MKYNDIQKFAVVGACLFSIFFEGYSTSMLAPVFPIEANNRSMELSMIGIVTGTFDISSLIFAFVFSTIESIVIKKYLFISGCFISAVSMVLFGTIERITSVTWYFVSCIIVRAFMGLGASLILSSARQMARQGLHDYPEFVNALMNISMTLGQMLGPSLGGLLYYVTKSNFEVACIVSGAFQFGAFIITAIALIPLSCDTVTSEQTGMRFRDLFDYITTPSIVIMSLPIIGLNAFTGIRDTTYAIYLYFQFNYTIVPISLVFLGLAIAFILAQPITGYIADKGYEKPLFLFTIIVVPITFGLYDLANNITALKAQWYMIPMMLTTSFLFAGLFSSANNLLSEIATRTGLRHCSLALWFQINRSIGRVIGTIVFGGVVMQTGYFYDVAFWTAVYMEVLSSITVIYLLFTFFQSYMQGR